MIADFFITLFKKGWKSKTVVFGFVVAVLGAAQQYLPEIQALIDPDLYGKLTFCFGIVVVALRFVTSTDLNNK